MVARPSLFSRIRGRATIEIKRPQSQASSTVVDDESLHSDKCPQDSTTSFPTELTSHSETIVELQSKLDYVESALGTKTNLVEVLERKLADSERSLCEAQNRTRTYDARQAELESALRSVQHEYDDVHATVCDQHSIIYDLRSRCDSAEARCSSAEETLANTLANLDAERKSHAQAQAQLGSLSRELAAEKAARQFAETCRNSEHTARVDAEERAADQARQVEELYARIASLSERCESLVAARNKVRSYAAGLEDELAQEKATRHQTKTFLETERAACKVAECLVEELRPALQHLQIAHRQVQKELRIRCIQLRDMASRDEALSRTITEQAEMCVRHAARISLLERTARDNLYHEGSDRTRMLAYEARLDKLTISLQHAVDEGRRKDEELRTLRAALEARTDELEKARAEVIEQEGWVQILEKRLWGAQQTIAAFAEEMRWVRREAKESRKTVRRLDAQLHQDIVLCSRRSDGFQVDLVVEDFDTGALASSRRCGQSRSPHNETLDLDPPADPFLPVHTPCPCCLIYNNA